MSTHGPCGPPKEMKLAASHLIENNRCDSGVSTERSRSVGISDLGAIVHLSHPECWEGGEWHVDPTHNSIITTGNGGTVPVKAQITIYYDSGRKRYDLVQPLKPREQMWVDVGKLIRERTPDKNGSVLPLDLMMGSYEIQDLTDRGVGNLFEGKLTVDKTYGHAAYGCATCCGYMPSAWMYWDPILTATGVGTGQDVWDRDNCTGTDTSVLDYFPSSSWGTGNHAIATAIGHMINGVAPGSTTNFATGTLTTGNVESHYCPRQQLSPSGTANVQPVISGPNTVWWFNGRDPNSSSYPMSVALTSSGGSSTTWSVAQADAKVNLSSTSGASITVTGTGTHFSGATGDISFTATANGVSSSPLTMSAKTPWKLVSRGAPQTSCFSSPETYTSTVSYDVHDNLDVLMSANIDWNEVLGSQTSENGSNWGSYSVAQSAGSTDPVQDLLAPPQLNASPAPVPTPTCSGQNSGATRYRSIPQNISVGTVNNGSGVHVQSDTLGYYVDHGQHDGIQVPAQPPQ